MAGRNNETRSAIYLDETNPDSASEAFGSMVAGYIDFGEKHSAKISAGERFSVQVVQQKNDK